VDGGPILAAAGFQDSFSALAGVVTHERRSPSHGGAFRNEISAFAAMFDDAGYII
jgi:hypothetical protein